jgi:hypothetical protein
MANHSTYRAGRPHASLYRILVLGSGDPSLTDGRTGLPLRQTDSDPAVGRACCSARTAGRRGIGNKVHAPGRHVAREPPPWRRHARSQTPPRLPRRPAGKGRMRPRRPRNGSGPCTGSARACVSVRGPRPWPQRNAKPNKPLPASSSPTPPLFTTRLFRLPTPLLAGSALLLTSESVDKIAPLDRLEVALSLSEHAANRRDPSILRPPWSPFLVALTRPGVHTARWRSVRIWIDLILSP